MPTLKDNSLSRSSVQFKNKKSTKKIKLSLLKSSFSITSQVDLSTYRNLKINFIKLINQIDVDI